MRGVAGLWALFVPTCGRVAISWQVVTYSQTETHWPPVKYGLGPRQWQVHKSRACHDPIPRADSLRSEANVVL